MSDDLRDRYRDIPPDPASGATSRDPHRAPPEDLYAAGRRDAARGRVTAPAIFLIGVGVLNMIAALGLLGNGVYVQSIGSEELSRRQHPDSSPGCGSLQMHYPQGPYDDALRNSYGGGALTLLCALLILFGGVRMLAHKSYNLAVIGSILAAIPCLSPSGCCLVGEFACIWSLIVLMNADVRSLFR